VQTTREVMAARIAPSILLRNSDKMKNCDSVITLAHETSVRLPLVGRFTVTGATWEISTNCQEILAIMRDVFQPNDREAFPADLHLYFYVDAGLPDGKPLRPHFRALEHFYYGTYGPGDSMLVDQRDRRVVGKLSLATARDVGYWKRVILPYLVGIVSACVGITPVHCACVVKDDLGLLIHGQSGAGKSTLALSLSLNGFSYLADDCTYISGSGSGLQCWGSSAPLKLLPEAVTYFPALASMVPGQSLNGEVAFEVEPTETFGVKRSPSCNPGWLIFIERTHEPNAAFRAIGRAESALRLASDLELLPPCIAGQREHQLAIIESLVQRGGWVLRHGLRPEPLALAIAQFCSRN
jgi:hypothetical protein